MGEESNNFRALEDARRTADLWRQLVLHHINTHSGPLTPHDAYGLLEAMAVELFFDRRPDTLGESTVQVREWHEKYHLFGDWPWIRVESRLLRRISQRDGGILAEWGSPRTVADVMGTVYPDRPDIIGGILREKSLNLLTALYGSGKTNRGLALGLHIAAGLPIPKRIGEPRSVVQRPVLYLNVDAPAEDVELVQQALCRGMGVDLDIPFHVQTALGFELRNPEHNAAVEDWLRALPIDRYGPPVLMVDALTGLSRQLDQMTPEIGEVPDWLMQLVNRYDATIELVHHANKGDRQYRGSPVLKERVTFAYEVEPVRDDDNPDVLAITVKPGDKRRGRQPDTLTLELTFHNLPTEHGSRLERITVREIPVTSRADLVREDLVAAVVLAVQEHPGHSQSQIASLVAVRKGVAADALRQAKTRGLVRTEPGPRGSIRYWPAERLSM